jgi:hypothetical protein
MSEQTFDFQQGAISTPPTTIRVLAILKILYMR